MVLLEAMSQGVPRSASTARRGRASSSRTGGRPPGPRWRHRGVPRGLAALMGDDAMRHRLAHAALKTAENFQIESVTDGGSL